MDNWDPRPVFVEGKYISTDTWFGSDGKPFQPQVHYFVGGATKMYGAALYRLRPQDFGELEHVDGISPAWPLSYDDFEPWYSKAEQLYQVRGNGGEDPTEGHRSAPTRSALGGWRPFFAEERLLSMGASVAGFVIAFYQVGRGCACPSAAARLRQSHPLPEEMSHAVLRAEHVGAGGHPPDGDRRRHPPGPSPRTVHARACRNTSESRSR
jgi:choline dehydrogenase-like flavoprotein